MKEVQFVRSDNIQRRNSKIANGKQYFNLEISEYIGVYKSYKSCFEKIRAKNKPTIPTREKDSFDFSDPKCQKFTKTIEGKDFMMYDNKKLENRIVIFISEYGFRLLSQCERWHGDGTFFSAPEPFNQVYLIHAYKHNQMLLAAYVLLKKKTEETYKEMFKAIRDKA